MLLLIIIHEKEKSKRADVYMRRKRKKHDET